MVVEYWDSIALSFVVRIRYLSCYRYTTGKWSKYAAKVRRYISIIISTVFFMSNWRSQLDLL